jgi:hypothetical protein
VAFRFEKIKAVYLKMYEQNFGSQQPGKTKAPADLCEKLIYKG